MKKWLIILALLLSPVTVAAQYIGGPIGGGSGRSGGALPAGCSSDGTGRLTCSDTITAGSLTIGTTGLSTVSNVLTSDKPISAAIRTSGGCAASGDLWQGGWDGTHVLETIDSAGAHHWWYSSTCHTVPSIGGSSFADLTGDPSDNTALQEALDAITAGGITISTGTPSTPGAANLNDSTHVLTIASSTGTTAFTGTFTAWQAPTLSTASIDTTGLVLTLGFSGNMDYGSGGATGWTLNTPTDVATYTSGSGTSTIVMSLASAIHSTDAPTVSYLQPTGGWRDSAHHVDLANVTTHAVTNGSTVSSGIQRVGSVVTGQGSVNITVSAGDLVVVGTDGHWVSFSDGTNTYVGDAGCYNGGIAHYLYASGGSKTITSTPSNQSMVVQIYSGISSTATVGVVKNNCSGTGTAGSISWTSNAPDSNYGANNLIIGGAIVISGSNPTSFTAGSGFSKIGDTSIGSFEDMITSTSGNSPATGLISGGSGTYYYGFLVEYKHQ